MLFGLMVVEVICLSYGDVLYVVVIVDDGVVVFVIVLGIWLLVVVFVVRL